jgi:hypothetical protein
MQIPITREARRFAILELAKRAGINARDCVLEVSDDRTSLYLDAHRNVGIVFPHFVRQFDESAFHTARYGWISSDKSSRSPLTPDFIVPCSQQVTGVPPLFLIDGRHARCAVDLGASILFSLSRVEERFSTERDQHGRFPASASLAVRHDYLDRPIVDEYGLALREAIQAMTSGWHPATATFRALITQDVDSVGIPFNVWSTGSRLRHTYKISYAIRDVASVVGLAVSAELKSVHDIVTLAQRHGLRSASFWKTGPRTKYDTGYDVAQPTVSKLISELRSAGVVIGIHPSYYTFGNRGRLVEEVSALREKLGEPCLGGRQHYLRWSPHSWPDWESCGLAFDSSVGFAEQPGFRAGTAVPYQPWLLEENRQARILEVPLILMDRTLTHYMRISGSQAISTAAQLIARVKAVGGVFTLLWHNELLFSSQQISLYIAILQQLADAAVYDLDSEVSAEIKAAA